MRSIRLATVSVVLTALLCVGLRRGQAQGDAFTYAGTSTVEASRALAAHLRQRGVAVTEQPDGVLRLEQRLTWMCQPRLAERGLDRLVCYLFFRINDQYRGSADLQHLAMTLNRRYNFGGFYVDTDGDLCFLTQLTFVDTIEGVELDAFLDYLAEVVDTLVQQEAEQLQRFLD